ncbi:MAG: aminotransferase class V-fold PLP-dependent enzyme [Candidatus Eremiobacteraeota bacterium]|nr:aminotransferase class V-fold PLP-dependent enzyme [Candidatus Eremiobacteraeota bacterium]
MSSALRPEPHDDAPPLSRDQFPIARDWAYCNHAAVGPLPRRTREAVIRVLDAQMCDGSAGIAGLEPDVEAARAQTAATLNAEADEIAFLRSTSDGALLVAHGLRWREGDDLILSDNEFGANAYPWLGLREQGVRIRLVRTPAQRMTVERLEELVTPRTRLVSVSYVTSLDGYRHDLSAIGRWCRERGVLFAVDAMQGFGHLPLDVRGWHIDFCYFGTAKWLLTPLGLSVVYVNRKHTDALRAVFASWRSVKDPNRYLDYSQPLASGARRFEGATINYPALMGFSQSLRLLDDAGFAAIEQHVLGLCDRLIQGAIARGIPVLSSRVPGTRSGIVQLGLGRHDVTVLNEEALRHRVGITIRDSGIRVSPHGYNDAADIDAVLELLGAA